MSRVGKKPITIPEGVKVKIEDQTVSVEGPKGELSQEIRPEIKVELKENKIFVSLQKETKQAKAFWGLTRALLSNMVEGVTTGFEKKLEIQGIGFRATVEGEDLLLYVGFSHPVKLKIPQNVKVSMEKNIISVSGINKELIGQFAATIRKVKPPEPYKGKGIRYLGEIVKRKIGKKVVTTG
jgi:large subunit ribosomal protein L6